MHNSNIQISSELDIDFIGDLVNPYMVAERERLCVEAGFVPNRFFKRGDEGTLTPVADIVLIRIARRQNMEMSSGLIVPLNVSKNYRLLKGTVVAVGPAVEHIWPGMLVEFDQQATFNYGDEGCDTPDELTAIRQENIIFCIDKGRKI